MPAPLRLDKHQRDLVMKASVDGYNDFDITLLYTLLRNVCSNLGDPSVSNLPPPSQGWGSEPRSTDITLSDDIERIRILRNGIFAHLPRAQLSQSEYNTYWNQLSDLCRRCTQNGSLQRFGRDYEKDLKDIETSYITETQAKDVATAIEGHWRQLQVYQQEQKKAISEIQTNQQIQQLQLDHIEEMQERQPNRTEDHLQHRVGDIIENRGLIIIGGEGHQILQTDLECSLHQDDVNKSQEDRGKSLTDKTLQELERTIIEVNEDATHCVPLHPLYTNTGLSVDELYAEVIVREDMSSIQRTVVSPAPDRHKVVKDPADLFMKDDKPVRNLYLLGYPARGKTTFCLYLLKLWCTAKAITDKAKMSIWQLGMSIFHFQIVFYVSMRHVDRCRSSVVGMICDDLFEGDEGNKDVIRHVLGDPQYRCLVIMDGLDEWIYSPEVHAKLRQKGLPNTGGISSNCSLLFASRHWKVDVLQPKYSTRDKVDEILGLTTNGISTVIENILVNFFRLQRNSPDYKVSFNKLKQNIEKSKFGSFMKTPMLVTMSVFLGHSKDYVQTSKTIFVLDQFDLLIRRAQECGQIEIDVVKTTDADFDSKLKVPKCVKKYSLISKYIVVLYKLGKLAFGGLISNESNLIFKREFLEEVLGKNDLELALKIGFVSQLRAQGRFHVPRVSIEFLHKSIQEALAALYVVCDTSYNAFSSLCEHCSTIEKLMEFSNVLIVMSGLLPLSGGKLSKHVAHVASNDSSIVEERESLNLIRPHGRALMLYRMQFECYEEMAHVVSTSKDLEPMPQYHVSDVVMDVLDENDTARSMTSDMMRGSPCSILSFSIEVHYGSQWSLKKLLDALPLCSNLSTLQMMHFSYTASGTEFLEVLPKLRNLKHICYENISLNAGDLDSRVVSVILKLPKLKRMELKRVQLHDDALLWTDSVSELKELGLCRLRFSTDGWKTFVASLCDMQKRVHVTIENSKIDDDVVRIIVSNFNVIKNVEH